MKVTHIFKTYFPDTQGGLEEAIRQISKYTTKQGIENEILTVSPSPNPSIVELPEARVIRYKMDLNHFSTPMSFSFLKNFKQNISGSDILHFHFPWPFGEINYLMNKVNIPSIVTYHSDIIKHNIAREIYKPISKLFLENVDIIIPTSSQYLSSSENLIPFRDKCNVINLTIDENRFSPLNDEIIDEVYKKYGEDFFLFVGVLRHYKGLDYLLDAMRSIDRNLLIVGTGDEEKRLKNKAERLGLNNVKFAGYVDDKYLPAFYHLCRAFVFPSINRAEAFGMSLLEASSFSRPMISTELSTGTSYVNKNGVTGLVIPPKNAGALQKALKKLSENDELCKKFGQNAKRRFDEKFNHTIAGEQYLELYKDIYKKDICFVPDDICDNHSNGQLDIVIVNYYSSDYLHRCLESIYNSLDDLPANIYIQDNGSTDNLKNIREQFPDVKITKNTRNIGFTAAVSNALRQGKASYIVIINPDSLVTEGFFPSMLEYLEKNPDIGILGPKILDRDGSVQGSARSFPTLISGLFGRTSLLSKWFPNNRITRRNILTKKKGHSSLYEADWVSGACMVVRRSAVNDVGLMDDQFFMYWEDVDWCRRMWKKGWKVLYYPSATVIHYVGGSSGKRPIRSLYEFHKSCYRYFNKYLPQPLSLLKPLLIFGIYLRFFFILSCYKILNPPVTRDTQPRILFFISEDWYFWSHRLPIARAAKDAGFEVLIATKVFQHKELIEKEGFKLIPINMKRNSSNLVKEIISFIEIIRIYRREKPDIVHQVALKPILYGSWAGKIAGIKLVVNAIAGLGFVFVAQGRKSQLLRRIVKYAYISAFSNGKSVGIFQNPEDMKLFTGSKILKEKNAILIRGSGVNTSQYKYRPEPTGSPVIVLPTRMLWDKGVREFIDAATEIKKSGVKCKFVLAGSPDPENPVSIPEETIRQWHSKGIVEWWGQRNDMPEVYARSNIVVLPSYREGLPKVLLEAASCGRAIVATDVPGCREIVRHKENGFLVPPYDSKSLAEAIKILVKDSELRAKMGMRGREIVEAEFSDEIVVKQTMDVYKKILVSSEFPVKSLLSSEFAS